MGTRRFSVFALTPDASWFLAEGPQLSRSDLLAAGEEEVIAW